ncbi:MAG TPA: hypothetical protein VNF47_26540 [Streptosporangiaceae bacterium]|nr:hypothetical protein [Streptosporangiaceae bacterium]
MLDVIVGDRLDALLDEVTLKAEMLVLSAGGGGEPCVHANTLHRRPRVKVTVGLPPVE